MKLEHNDKLKILFIGGNSGGHVFPLVGIIRELKSLAEKKGLKLELIVVSSGDFAKGVFETEKGVEFRAMKFGKLRRRFSFRTLGELFLAPFRFLRMLYFVWREMPDLVYGNGGSLEVPFGIIAWLYRIPLFIHEADTVPGLANKILARFADRIGVSFSETLSFFSGSKTALIGNPIRPELMEEPQGELREVLGVNSYKAGLLILGGSQGAKQLNQLVLASKEDLLKQAEIVHQCGQKHKEKIEAELDEDLSEDQKSHYHLKGFLGEQELNHAYKWADLAVARAGAGLIFELAALGVPSILIPYPDAASGHQKKNAYAYSQGGASRVLETPNATPSLFVNEVEQILDSPELRERMQEAAHEFAIPKAGEKVAKAILNLSYFK